MTTRIVTDANGRKHITNEPLLHPPQRPWVGLTDEEVDQGLVQTNYSMKTAQAWRHGVEWAQFNLMRKNT